MKFEIADLRTVSSPSVKTCTTRLGWSKHSCLPPLNLVEASNSKAFTESQVPHKFSYSHYAGPPFYSEIDRAILATEQALVFDHERLYLDSYHNRELMETIVPVKPHVGSLVNGSIEADFVTSREKRVVRTPAILIKGPHAANYHHWLLEILPRFWIFDEAPKFKNTTIILPKLTRKFQTETLNKILTSSTKILFHDQEVFFMDKLLFPSFLAPGGHSRKQLDWLRSKFLWASEPKSSLLYISRRDAVNGRRVVNEGALVGKLYALGFQEVLLTGKSHEEQVKLFSKAKVIIGASGAGITNHVFAPEGAHVIEFHPEAYTNRAHYFTSSLLNQTYQFVICNQDAVGDMIVPVDEALQCVERVL